MIVNTKDIQTQGSLGGRKIAMTLDQNSLPHLMSVITDLYSDPTAAVIREYTTNALDSHLASGQTRPVELSTPNRLSPFFVVQDFGVGMSEDDIENVYSQFGNSTKRGNNLEAGMLGLGSKSALTYTEQFNLISIKDGERVLASISRSADGSSDIEIVSVTKTDDGNGVTIKIPVQTNIQEFGTKVDAFAKFVNPGSIIVNGDEVESGAEFICPDIAVIPNSDYYARDRVVMGNVSYPTGKQILRGHQVLFYVEMGSVDFTPSREELMFTDRTKATIGSMEDKFHQTFAAYLKDQVADAETYADAWQKSSEFYDKFGHMFGSSMAYHGGLTLPRHIEVIYGRWSTHVSDCRIHYDERNITAFDESTPIITDWKNSRLNRNQIQKIYKFFSDKGETVTNCFFTDGPLNPGIMTKNPQYSWIEIKKTLVPKRASVVRPPATWLGFGGAGSNNYESWFIPDASKKIVYGAKSDILTSDIRQIATDDVQFFYVTPSQEDRFLRHFPLAVTMNDVLKEKLVEYLNNLTKEDYLFFENKYSQPNLPCELDSTKIDDPKLVAIIEWDAGKYDEQEERYNLAKSAHNRVSYGDRDNYKFPEFNHDSSKYLDNYALFKRIRFNSWNVGPEEVAEMKDHLVQYANMVYAQMVNTTDKEDKNDAV